MHEPSTQIAPSKVSSIQAFVSRAGFFWRGGAVTLVLVFGVSAAIAYALGDVFESEATLQVIEGAAPQDPADPIRESPIDTVRRALFSPATLEQLTHEIEPPTSDGTPFQAQVDRTKDAIQLRPRSDRDDPGKSPPFGSSPGAATGEFAIAFRAGTPALAQRGADWLAQAAVRSFEASGEPTGEESRRTKALEERTKELATFVAEHPEVALTGPAPGPSATQPSTTPAPADSAVVVLQQQRATLEWRIADAEKKEVAGTNPY